MPLISSFDPWRNSLCTCPPKLTFNPYSGCDHQCIYCYATSYVPNFADCRPKKALLQNLKREAAKLKGEIVSMSNSSDPYPIREATTGLTRQCLEILADSNCRIQIITKSDLVIRDCDLLSKVPSTVAFTVTTDDDALAKKLEPHAPSPTRRLKAAEHLISLGLPVSVRIDPILPFLNDQPNTLIATLASIGVKHVTSSTYKVKPDNWRRLAKTMPELADKLKTLYFEQGERIGGCILLPADFRLQLLIKLRNASLAKGLKFAVCREGFQQLNTATCDGSWMLPRKEWRGLDACIE